MLRKPNYYTLFNWVLKITFHTFNGTECFSRKHWFCCFIVFIEQNSDFITYTFPVTFRKSHNYQQCIMNNFVQIGPESKFMFKVIHKGTTTTPTDAVLLYLLVNISKKLDSRKLVSK